MAMVTKASDRITKIIIHIFFILLSFMFLIPVWSILSISLMNDIDIANFGYQLIPSNPTLAAYKYIFTSSPQIFTSYKITIIISAASTFLYVMIGSMIAYAISRSDFAYRSKITFYMFFTMLFGGGMVPTYLLIRTYLHMGNTIWALIIPTLGNVWSIFILRTFFQQLPGAIIESATIDGASEWTIYTRIILPLSTPAIATIGLLHLLTVWNSWTQAMLYVDDPNLYPLQYLLQTMLRNMQELMRQLQMTGMMVDLSNFPMESARMAMAVVAVLPILLIFPFFQKYFVQGLTVGSVKG